MEPLKPCPFCGESVGVTDLGRQGRFYSVICICGASAGSFPDRDEAREAWNTRVVEPRVVNETRYTANEIIEAVGGERVDLEALREKKSDGEPADR